MRMVSNSTQDQTAGYLASKVVAGANITLSTVNAGGSEKLQISGAAAPVDDHEVIVTGADTTPGYLGAKLAAGSNVALSTLNPGANEQVQIDVTIPPASDELVKADATDAVAAYLDTKITAGYGLSTSVVPIGGGQNAIQIGSDNKVFADTLDNQVGFLKDKMVAGTNITLTTVDQGGGNLGVQIDAAGGGSDILVKATAADTTAEYLDDKIVAGANVTKTVIDKGLGNLAVQIDAAGTPAIVDVTALCSLDANVTISYFNVMRRLIDNGTRVRFNFTISGTLAVPSGILLTFPDTMASAGFTKYVPIFAMSNFVIYPAAGMGLINGGNNFIQLNPHWTGDAFPDSVNTQCIGEVEFDLT